MISNSRLAGIAVLSALVGCFLAIAQLGEKPRVDRIAFEFALVFPVAIWLLGRRFTLKH